MFRNIAYGIVTASAMSFPNLKHIRARRSDVAIRVGPFDHPPRLQDSNVVKTDDEGFLYWDDLLMAVLRARKS